MLSSELKSNGQRLVQASEEWLTLVGSLVYDVYGAATTIDEARSALGLQSMAWQDPRNTLITGGHGELDVIRVNRTPVEPTDAVPLGHVKSALRALALPFTAPGDLLVYKTVARTAPTVLPVGTQLQLLDAATASWIDPPLPVPETALPSSVIPGLYTVSVGATPHTTLHDQHFATVTAFNEWAAGKIVLDTLTVLPNDWALTDTETLVLPRTVAGASVVLGSPTTSVNETTYGKPISGRTLQARGTYIQAQDLTLFARYDLHDCELDVQAWYLWTQPVEQTLTALGPDCRGRVNQLTFARTTAAPLSTWEFRSCELDVSSMDMDVVDGAVIRMMDTSVYIRNLSEPVTKTLLRLHDSSLYVVESYDAPVGNLEVVAMDSHVHLASGHRL